MASSRAKENAPNLLSEIRRGSIIQKRTLARNEPLSTGRVARELATYAAKGRERLCVGQVAGVKDKPWESTGGGLVWR